MTDRTRPADDELVRHALRSLATDADAAPLVDPEELRADASARRRRTVLSLAAAAVVLAVVVAGALQLGPDDSARPLPARSTTSTEPAPSPSASSTPSATARATSTDVIGEDGSLGPFRVGMTRAQVDATIREAYPDGSVRIEQLELGGGFDVTVVVQDGVETGLAGRTAGTGVIGVFDAADHDDAGILDALLAPSTATIRGLGVGASVTAFERAFPDRVTTNESSTVYLLTLDDGVRLQLGRPSAYLDPSTVDVIVVLPPGARSLGAFPYFT